VSNLERLIFFIVLIIVLWLYSMMVVDQQNALLNTIEETRKEKINWETAYSKLQLKYKKLYIECRMQ